MSWLGGYKPSNSKSNSEADTKRKELEKAREAKRKELETERLNRAKKRAEHRKLLESAIQSQKEADEAYKEFLDIAEDIFSEDLFASDEESEQIEKMANFDVLNADNGADAMKNLGQIKVNWCAEDPNYFFQKLEIELQIFEVNKQYTKRQALIRLLPDSVGLEFKHLINLQEDAAGNQAYKTLKSAIIKSYGPRPGASFRRAMERIMEGKPSVLLKLLTSDICKHNLSKDCCCNSTIWGLFEMKIPMYLKTGLANETFNSTNMNAIMDKADNLWSANQVNSQINIVSQNLNQGTTASVAVSSPVTTTDSIQTEVAAVNRGRGTFRGRRGNRGNPNTRGRGNQNRGQNHSGPDPRGKRHESMPPWNSCSAHWVYADNAFKCQSPTTCPLKDKIKPKNSSNSA